MNGILFIGNEHPRDVADFGYTAAYTIYENALSIASSYYTCVAAFWNDLILSKHQPQALGGLNSRIRVARAVVGGARYNVVEWRDMSFQYPSVGLTPLNHITFQIVFPVDTPDTLHILYGPMASYYGGLFGENFIGTGLSGRYGIVPPRERKGDWLNPPPFCTGDTLTYRGGIGRGDGDLDRMNDAREAFMGSEDTQPDTDGDGLLDGWELRYGGLLIPRHNLFNDLSDGTFDGEGGTPPVPVTMDPRVNNLDDGDPDNDPQADPDGDGLTNQQECDHNTDPFDADTDRDGAPDAWEVFFATDPLSADSFPSPGDAAAAIPGFGPGTPGGGSPGFGPGNPDGRAPGWDDLPVSPPPDATPPPDVVSLTFTFGDPSSSSSEKYSLALTPASGDEGRKIVPIVNRQYGQTEPASFRLKRGASYEVTLSHAGTNRETPPDYDYLLTLPNPLPSGVVLSDDEGLLGNHSVAGTTSSFSGAGKTATLYLPKIETKTVATQPADRTRKTIGVGEEVELKILPEELSASLWSITEDAGTLSYYSGNSTTYTAPSMIQTRECIVTVNALINGIMCQQQFKIISPTGVLMENDSIQYANSGKDWVAIKYWAKIYLLPDTVNFYKASLYEGASPVYKDGYFTLYVPTMEPHVPNGPHLMTTTVVEGKGTLCMESDEITGVAEIINSTISGNIYWDLPWSYTVGHSDQGPLEVIRQNTHMGFPNAEPTLTVTKDQSGYRVVFGTNELSPVNP